MSKFKTKPVPVAVAVSDIHAESRTPPARAEKDWYEVQTGYFKQLEDIADGLPILVAGDVFNRWNPTPELISFMIRNLPPRIVAVPGQHDLPLHNYEDVKKSAYWTLKEAGIITDVPAGKSYLLTNKVMAHGFPWGTELKPHKKEYDDTLDIALVHKLVWWKKPFPNAPENGQVDEIRKSLNGFDVIVSGDNHEPFLYENLFNGGCFIRRRSDEMHRKPHIGVIYSDGTVKRKCLDTSADQFKDVNWSAELEDKHGVDADNFVQGVQNVEEVFDDFKDAVRRYARKSGVKKAVGVILEQLLRDEE